MNWLLAIISITMLWSLLGADIIGQVFNFPLYCLNSELWELRWDECLSLIAHDCATPPCGRYWKRVSCVTWYGDDHVIRDARARTLLPQRLIKWQIKLKCNEQMLLVERAEKLPLHPIGKWVPYHDSYINTLEMSAWQISEPFKMNWALSFECSALGNHFKFIQ